MLPYNLYSIELISEKHRAFIALVIKFYYRWVLSYTLNTSYYTAFYKTSKSAFIFKLREDSFFAILQSCFKIR